MTMSNRYPDEPKNPFISNSIHWHAWNLVGYSPKFFSIKEANHIYKASLCIDVVSYDKLICTLRLIGFNEEDIKRITRYHHINNTYKHMVICGIHQHQEKMFRTHLKALQALQQEQING